MSAFFIAINRDKRTFESAIAEKMMAQLDHFGHDGKRLIVKDYFALGYQSTWVLPEEKGEQQPLYIENDCDGHKVEQNWFMFYGRLDNREFLFNRLGKRKESRVTDATLAQAYFKRFGLAGLSDLIGPFVFVSFDVKSGNLTMARDGMGARNLSYQITDKHIFVTTNEMALAAHPSVGYHLNDETVARHLVGDMPPRPSSMVAGIDVLYPGHFLNVKNASVDCQRFYFPDPTKRVIFENDNDYAIEFRRLLTQAVDRRMRSLGNIGTQLSGGLDSVPITILAAKKALKDQQLCAYSWVFDQYPESDERQYSGPLCQVIGIEQIEINCDTRWLEYDDERLLDPLGPIYNPFMIYNHELFKQAQLRSTKVMLNGIHGDILYGYRHGILYELAKAGEIRLLLYEAWSLFKSSNSAWSFIKGYILGPLKFVDRLLTRRRQNKKVRDDILQADIVEILKSSDAQPAFLTKEARRALRPLQWQVVFGDLAGSDAATGRFLEAKYAVERRYPFRDRDLCEFMLAIPTRQLAFGNVKRPIVKRAFLADFPANMASRNIKADFSDVTLDGFRNDVQNFTWASSTSREWSYYVKECYFEGKVMQNHQLEVVKWRCGYYDYWKSVCYHPTANKLGLRDEVSN